MAADYIVPDSAAPGRLEKFLKVFIIFAVLGLGAELVWLLGVGPFRPFSRIDITGFDGLSREEIIAKAGITANSSFFSTNVRSLEKALMSQSSIEYAKVFKYFPSRLQIVLEGRRAVASLLCPLEGRTVPVIFDSHGVVFEVGGAESIVPGEFPVVSGLIIQEPYAGMQLPSMFIPLFMEIEKIRISAPELLGAVSEIKINRKPFDSYDLILYPIHKKIKVRLSELNEDLLRYTLLMVDVLSQKESGIDSFDFRSGIASYIPKEASSE